MSNSWLHLWWWGAHKLNIDGLIEEDTEFETKIKPDENLEGIEDAVEQINTQLNKREGKRWNEGNRKHVEIHIDGLSFPCQICGKTFRSRQSFSQHKFSQHKQQQTSS